MTLSRRYGSLSRSTERRLKPRYTERTAPNKALQTDKAVMSFAFAKATPACLCR